MADLKTGAKFIEKDPPLADQETKSSGRKILDYLAYLKEQLNFIFTNYGRRLTDANGNINELTRTADQLTSTIYNPDTGLVSQVQQNAEAITTKVSTTDYNGQEVMSLINQDASSVTINASKVNLTGYVTMTDLSTSGSTTINGANITTGTISADRIGAGTITTAKLATDVTTAISSAQTTANGANSQEQLIYISKASGTTSVSATTTWVTNTTGNQNTWTIKRPQYSSSYPVLFVATQRKTVAGTVTCTTPMIDETTTVIDGGRIVANSITAAKVNMSDLFAQNITATNFNITGGSINVTTDTASRSFLQLTTSYSDPSSTFEHYIASGVDNMKHTLVSNGYEQVEFNRRDQYGLHGLYYSRPVGSTTVPLGPGFDLSNSSLCILDSSGNNAAVFPPTALTASGTFSATTSYKYSGYSVTVPANRFFTLTIHAYYSAVAPVSVCASTSSTSIASGAMQFEYNVDSQNTRARGTFSGKNTAQTTYYIWAKAASAGTLGIGADGYYF